jgi:hypothetical protein
MDKEVDGDKCLRALLHAGRYQGCTWNLPVGSPLMLRQRLGGEISKLGEQLHLNDTQVREAEGRLGRQHTVIARLHASSRDTTSAQESLEVISIRSLLSCDEEIARGK